MTIETELAACRAAFAAYEVAHGAPATWAHGVHHDIAVEPLTERIEKRLRYIRVNKPPQEQAVRFANLRPIETAVVPRAVVVAHAKADAARDKYDAARDKYEAAWDKADAAWAEADAARDKYGAAWNKYFAARAKAAAERNRVRHARICPIPETCTWDGKTFLGAVR